MVTVIISKEEIDPRWNPHIPHLRRSIEVIIVIWIRVRKKSSMSSWWRESQDQTFIVLKDKWSILWITCDNLAIMRILGKILWRLVVEVEPSNWRWWLQWQRMEKWDGCACGDGRFEEWERNGQMHDRFKWII